MLNLFKRELHVRKVLIYRIRSSEFTDKTIAWDVSSKSLRDDAYVDLFNIIDRELEAYKTADSVTCALMPLARNGNPEACEALLTYRRNRDNESFEEVELRRRSVHPVITDDATPNKTVQVLMEDVKS